MPVTTGAAAAAAAVAPTDCRRRSLEACSAVGANGEPSKSLLMIARGIGGWDDVLVRASDANSWHVGGRPGRSKQEAEKFGTRHKSTVKK